MNSETPNPVRNDEISPAAVDLMAALKESLNQAKARREARYTRTDPVQDDTNTGLKPLRWSDDAQTVKKCEDGWAWRCWRCDNLGRGHLTETAAIRELRQHQCNTAPNASGEA